MSIDALTQGEFVSKFEHLRDELDMTIFPTYASSPDRALDRPRCWQIHLRGRDSRSHYVSRVDNTHRPSNTTGNITYKIEEESDRIPVPQQKLDLLESVYIQNGWKKIELISRFSHS